MISNYYEEDEVMVMSEPLIDTDYSIKPTYTIDEFADRLAIKLGQHFGLNDIREVL